MKKTLTLLLLIILGCAAPKKCCSQNSWVRFEVQFDFYAPAESNFFMVSDDNGDTSIFFQPTNQYEYLDTIIGVSSGNYTISLRDSFGDGWMSAQPASFRMGNVCQGPIINWNPVLGSFFQRDTTVNIMPCPPPIPPQIVSAKVIINFDQYPSETSWSISDSNGTVHATGSGYGTQPINSTIEETVWIPKGPLFFQINDAYGDGLEGSLWQGQDGSYFVKQCNDTLVYGTDPAFGFDSIHSFVSDSCPPIFGCTDNDYLEYNVWATVDDSSCTTLKIFGCTDSTMYNYDPNANTMELIDTCVFTLILHDLMGNGWVGSNLRLLLPDTLYDFTHTGGFTNVYQVGITAPEPASFVFTIDPLAQFTTIECGFTLINPEGDTMISIQPPFITPSLNYPVVTYCGNQCEEKIYGCIDSTAINYDSLANTDDASCYYNPGCTNPVYLEYDSNYDFDDGSCNTLVVIGCMDSTAFNYVDSANTELPNSCIAVVEGCMQALAFNYNPNANTPDSCIAVVYGCTSPGSFNYDSLANTDDNSCTPFIYGCTDATALNFNPLANTDDNSCIAIVYGCTDATMYNYDSLANSDNGSCIPFEYGCTDSTQFNYNPAANTEYTPSNCVAFIYGCTDPSALNYDPLANTDDFSCVLPIYGCMDSTAYNFNPLANVDNNTCVPFIYGCTDPSALNFNAAANTEDFSCIDYIYGCTDSSAINYDSLANTDNGSCIPMVVGCTDESAWNYNPLANVPLGHDSLGCLYAADCSATEPGEPFFLNDECYAWVISVDDYCCENEWDEICEATYDYCWEGWTGPQPPARISREDIFLYPNPTKGLLNISKKADIEVYNPLGQMIIKRENITILDMSTLTKGIYTIKINKLITKQIIKN